ncbi:membrane-bound lysozyme inhibitor of c-type lysozyme MliC [Mesocricetibacter intestinalis]|uniref:Membrane-bound lysozyme inhibitor of c-type lysozyme MliC n=2 Tax=Mesocricetibacter intestinalis TaxID=1521930 RepID=A0A4R6VFG1_9PAST|nr:membrane-bound lysozyme inhibitor of c-type lysozyme MliC [Mesocricetibacter intestinalis]
MLCSIVACSAKTGTVNPSGSANTQTKPVQVLDKTSQQRSAALYRCKDDKQVRVVSILPAAKGKKGKIKAINLSFNNVTEKLVLTITESGKKYTNIHWHWYERTNSNMLTNSIGEVLAEQCVLSK